MHTGLLYTCAYGVCGMRDVFAHTSLRPAWISCDFGLHTGLAASPLFPFVEARYTLPCGMNCLLVWTAELCCCSCDWACGIVVRG